MHALTFVGDGAWPVWTGPTKSKSRAGLTGTVKFDSATVTITCELTYRDENTSGPLLVKLVRRRTARDATIVDAIAAGTLKIMDITAFKLRSMNIVAMRLATKLKRGQRIRSERVLNQSTLTHATMKKIKPSPKIIFTSLLRPLLGKRSLYPVRHKTRKSKTIE